MTIIEQKLIQNSQAIFDTLEKWDAFNELQQLNAQIVEHWLAVGTKKLRENIMPNLSKDWSWKPWGNERDTRWYLEAFGFGSLSIGFGWRYQFHLHLIDANRFDSKWIDEQLKTPKYAKLLTPFGFDPRLDFGYGSKAMERNYNFTFENPNVDNIPIHELAWYAAHRTEDFVKQAAIKIKRFTSDLEMTDLLKELNSEARGRMVIG